MAGRREKKGKERARKRGRKEISAAEATSKDEDSVPSPKISRYPTRNSRAITSKPATLRSPVRNVITRTTRQSSRLNPLKVRPVPNRKPTLSQNGENALPYELRRCISKHPPEDNDLISNAPAASSRYHHPDTETTNVGKTITAGSLDNWSAPISKHVMDQQASPFHEVISTLHRNNYVDIQAPTKFINNNRGLSRTNSNTSINVTEFAKRVHDDMDDDPESAPEPSLEDVWGHKVRSEFAPLLRRVFDNHGDITSQTVLESPNIVSNYLQQLCRVCEHLERAKFLQVKRAELDSMLADVRDFERAKLDVGWLRERIEYVSRVWIDFQRYYSLKEELGKYEVSIGSLEKKLDAYKNQLFDLQRKIGDVEGELEAKWAEAEPMRNVVLDIKARVKTLVKGTLMDGVF